jgi:hypothetical protein
VPAANLARELERASRTHRHGLPAASAAATTGTATIPDAGANRGGS